MIRMMETLEEMVRIFSRFIKSLSNPDDLMKGSCSCQSCGGRFGLDGGPETDGNFRLYFNKI
jgi:hypothetical protein